MTTTISYDQVKTMLKNIIEAEGMDHRTPIYVVQQWGTDDEPSLTTSCRYIEPDLSGCSCLVGRVFDKLGVETELLQSFDEDSVPLAADVAAGQVTTALDVAFDPEARLLLCDVQSAQDGLSPRWRTQGLVAVDLDGEPRAVYYDTGCGDAPGKIVGYGAKWGTVYEVFGLGEES